MAKQTIEQLRTRAIQVRDESTHGANTATRVGGLIEDTVDTLSLGENAVQFTPQTLTDPQKAQARANIGAGTGGGGGGTQVLASYDSELEDLQATDGRRNRLGEYLYGSIGSLSTNVVWCTNDYSSPIEFWTEESDFPGRNFADLPPFIVLRIYCEGQQAQIKARSSTLPEDSSPQFTLPSSRYATLTFVKTNQDYALSSYTLRQ